MGNLSGAQRFMGTEIEYGIIGKLNSNDETNPIQTSNALIDAFSHNHKYSSRRPRWDYQDESPLTDVRGFVLPRNDADSSLLTDIADAYTNLVLTNGGRYYVDHAHPEYSSPECTNPVDAMKFEMAGDQIIMKSLRELKNLYPDNSIKIYKNNTDGKGASYGAHENYLVKREIPFSKIVQALTPFFILRQIFVGSGRVGLGQFSEIPGFQISQRSDFFETEVGLETTLKRPIINTRDEPHSDASKFRRLHVIIGDSNRSQVSTYLKLALTSIILDMIENDFTSEFPIFRKPVTALRSTSHDIDFVRKYEFSNRPDMNILELADQILDTMQNFCTQFNRMDDQTRDALVLVTRILSEFRLGKLDSPFLVENVEWCAKYHILDKYRSRNRVDWDDPRLRYLDIQWSEIGGTSNMFEELEKQSIHRIMVDPSIIVRAAETPPENTRAFLRGKLIEHFGADIISASWDSIVIETDPLEPLQRISLMDPFWGTSQDAKKILSRLGEPQYSAADLVADLSKRP